MSSIFQQQEEADRKAARLREMDKRRAAIASKKADLDAAEKVKQQGERRKREREEGPEKKVTRAAVKVSPCYLGCLADGEHSFWCSG